MLRKLSRKNSAKFFSSILCSYLEQFFAQARKNEKKNPSQKQFLIFPEMEASTLILKTFLYFLLFWEMELFNSSSKNKKLCLLLQDLNFPLLYVTKKINCF